MEFDFSEKKGTGVFKLLPHYPEAADIISKLLIYNHNHRLSAAQALKHPYFKELREEERILQEGSPRSIINSSLTPTHMYKIRMG